MILRTFAILATVTLGFRLCANTANGDWLYWGGEFLQIQRACTTGDGFGTLMTPATPRAIALDLVGGRIYWGDGDGLRGANLDGSAVEAVVEGDSVGAVALDVGSATVYYSTWEQIYRANLDGSDIRLIVTDLPGFECVAVDTTAGKLYWTNSTTGWRAGPLIFAACGDCTLRIRWPHFPFVAAGDEASRCGVPSAL